MQAKLQSVMMLTVLVLTGCFVEPKAPKEYEAVESGNAADGECPDLEGSFEVPRALVSKIATQLQRDDGSARLLTFERTRHSHGYDAFRHQTRAQIKQALAEISVRQPEEYSKLRDKLLRPSVFHLEGEPDRLSMPAAAVSMGDSFSQRIGHYGSPCTEYWVNVKSGRGPGEDQHHEIWLARGRDGALLAKTVIIQHKSFNNFGSAGQINLGVTGVEWQRLGMPVQENTAAFSAAELSSLRRVALLASQNEDDAATEVREDEAPVPQCAMADRLVEFNQGILSRLPKGGELTLFVPDPEAKISAAACASIKMTLGLKTNSSAEVSALTAALMRERMVRDFEVIETNVTPRGIETRLRVTVPAVVR